jgi:hypothetical protein
MMDYTPDVNREEQLSKIIRILDINIYLDEFSNLLNGLLDFLK